MIDYTAKLQQSVPVQQAQELDRVRKIVQDARGMKPPLTGKQTMMLKGLIDPQIPKVEGMPPLPRGQK
tara:strand:+ start:1115 stop:1318 length:204 start_codon:yes stop_codon:yes gene_type:complete